MPVKTDEQTEIRRYLLGNVSIEAGREAVEEKLMADEAYFERLLVEEEELIQDYADGDLTVGERTAFERNFLISDERRQKVNFSRALKRYADERKSKREIAELDEKNKKRGGLNFLRFFSAPIPLALASVVVVAASALFVWNFFLRTSNVESAMLALDRAYRAERPLESRVTRFNYAPFVEVRGGRAEKYDARERQRAEMLSLEADDRPTAANLQLAARLYLVKGQFDRAVAELEKASAIDAQNAEILSDTGTAYLEKSKKTAPQTDGESLELAAKALDYFDKALAVDPKLPEARFNRAISLQVLHSPTEARAAWQDYLKLDDDSPWAEEARQNLKSLTSSASQSRTSDELLKDFLTAYRANDRENAYRIVSRNREMIKSKLIARQLAFLFLKTADPAEKQNYLAALTFTGDLEKEKSGDAFFADIAEFYSSLPEEKQAELVEAQNLIQTGYALCLDNENREALDAFARARAVFDRTGDFWEAAFCDYWIGYCLNRSNKIRASARILVDLADFSRKRNYYWLAAQSFSWLANDAGAQKEFSKAIEYNRQALDLAEKTSDLYLTQKSFSQLTDIYRRVGDYRQATDYAAKTLETLSFPEASGRQKYRDYNALARMFFLMKYYGAALAFQKESLNSAIEQNDPAFIYSPSIDLGLILGAQGKYAQAFDAFGQARAAAENFRDEELRKKSRADVGLQEAHILRRTKNCGAALKNYDAALAFYDAGEFQANSYEAHKGRLLCYLERGDDSAFQEELAVISGLFRDYRTKILEEQNRNSFFDNEQSVYDIAVDYEFGKRNYEKAFDYSEQSRSRSLLDLRQNLPVEVSHNSAKPEIKFSSVISEPLRFAQIQTEIPESAQLLQYSVLSDKTLVWLITRDGLQVAKIDISASDLEEKVAVYLESVTRDDSLNGMRQNELAKELYRILIAPLENDLDAGKTLCIVPDKILFRLSFAALVSPFDQNYLVEPQKKIL